MQVELQEWDLRVRQTNAFQELRSPSDELEAYVGFCQGLGYPFCSTQVTKSRILPLRSRAWSSRSAGMSERWPTEAWSSILKPSSRCMVCLPKPQSPGTRVNLHQQNGWQIQKSSLRRLPAFCARVELNSSYSPLTSAQGINELRRENLRQCDLWVRNAC